MRKTKSALRASCAAFVVLLGMGACSEAVVDPPFAGATSWSTRAFQAGSQMVLEQVVEKDLVRVALEERWGGSIVEISLNGLNFVNAHDPGREIQLSLYDGTHTYDECAACNAVWGWNPVQAGDVHTAGSRILEKRLNSEGLYVKLRPLEWYPDNKGGGSGWPMPSDIEVEQWVSFLTEMPGAIRLRYRIRHLAADLHADTYLQEFPAVYVNREFARFITYSGPSPWTNAEVSAPTLTRLFVDPPLRLHTAERWGAFVNENNIGLTIYTPGSYPIMTSGVHSGSGGPAGSGTAYTHPYNPFGVAPLRVIEGDVYLLVGDHRQTRKAIYGLHQSIAVKDVAAPIAEIESPRPDATVRGMVDLTGWAFDNTDLQKMEIWSDGSRLIELEQFSPRPDISRRWPGAPAVRGFTFRLDTSQIPNGRRELTLLSTDAAGNTSRRAVTVSIAN